VGVFTATAAGGTAVASVQNVGSTTTASYKDLTLSTAANANVFTASALYFNVNAAASGITCDVAIYGDIVTL
jgi:hypothetical protein